MSRKTQLTLASPRTPCRGLGDRRGHALHEDPVARLSPGTPRPVLGCRLPLSLCVVADAEVPIITGCKCVYAYVQARLARPCPVPLFGKPLYIQTEGAPPYSADGYWSRPGRNRLCRRIRRTRASDSLLPSGPTWIRHASAKIRDYVKIRYHTNQL